MTKARLDVLLVRRGLVESRERAQALVMAGDVLVDGQPVLKSGAQLADSATIELRAPPPYVSRGGLKLAKALDEFGIDPGDRVAIDVGASTGGFTDCLLQRGATRVYAVDVGYGQLHWKLRQDARVVPIERTNIRFLESLPEQPMLAVVDTSFISLRLVLPAVARLCTPDADYVTLVKPQFEAGRGQVGKGGVVRDPAVHRGVLADLVAWAGANGFVVRALTVSPITGPAGNREFLAWLGHDSPVPQPPLDLDAVLSS